MAPVPVPLVSIPAFEITEGVALVLAKDSTIKKFESDPVNAELSNNKQSDVAIIFSVFNRMFFLEMISKSPLQKILISCLIFYLFFLVCLMIFS